MQWIGLSFQLQQLVIGPRRPTALREDEPPLGLGNARGKRIAQAKAKVGDQRSIFRRRDGVAGIRAGRQSGKMGTTAFDRCSAIKSGFLIRLLRQAGAGWGSMATGAGGVRRYGLIDRERRSNA